MERFWRGPRGWGWGGGGGAGWKGRWEEGGRETNPNATPSQSHSLSHFPCVCNVSEVVCVCFLSVSGVCYPCLVFVRLCRSVAPWPETIRHAAPTGLASGGLASAGTRVSLAASRPGQISYHHNLRLLPPPLLLLQGLLDVSLLSLSLFYLSPGGSHLPPHPHTPSLFLTGRLEGEDRRSEDGKGKGGGSI